MTKQNKTYTVKKAYFPFNIILFIFKKMKCKEEECKVAMIDPIFLNILTIGKPYQLQEKHYKHEAYHIQQVKREGRLKFIFKYLYYNIKYGYENNPYEIEAREAENK